MIDASANLTYQIFYNDYSTPMISLTSESFDPDGDGYFSYESSTYKSLYGSDMDQLI